MGWIVQKLYLHLSKINYFDTPGAFVSWHQIVVRFSEQGGALHWLWYLVSLLLFRVTPCYNFVLVMNFLSCKDVCALQCLNNLINLFLVKNDVYSNKL